MPTFAPSRHEGALFFSGRHRGIARIVYIAGQVEPFNPKSAAVRPTQSAR